MCQKMSGAREPDTHTMVNMVTMVTMVTMVNMVTNYWSTRSQLRKIIPVLGTWGCFQYSELEFLVFAPKILIFDPKILMIK